MWWRIDMVRLSFSFLFCRRVIFPHPVAPFSSVCIFNLWRVFVRHGLDCKPADEIRVGRVYKTVAVVVGKLCSVQRVSLQESECEQLTALLNNNTALLWKKHWLQEKSQWTTRCETLRARPCVNTQLSSEMSCLKCAATFHGLDMKVGGSSSSS